MHPAWRPGSCGARSPVLRTGSLRSSSPDHHSGHLARKSPFCLLASLGSGGLGERDLVAKKDLQLMDEAADPAFVVPPADEEVSAEIAEPRAWIREQVPDDDQDGAGDGDQ